MARFVSLVGALAGTLALLVACSGEDDTDVPAGGAAEVAEECDLLADAEITEAIGTHNPAEPDMYFGGCAWYTNVAPTDTGFRPGVIVAVVPQIVFDQVAHVGEPIEEFGSGATYDSTHGELWFRCRGQMHCGLKLRIADSDRRAELARQLGRLVKKRA